MTLKVDSDNDMSMMVYRSIVSYKMNKSHWQYEFNMTYEAMKDLDPMILIRMISDATIIGANQCQEKVWEIEWEKRQQIQKTYSHYKDKLKPGQRIV